MLARGGTPAAAIAGNATAAVAWNFDGIHIATARPGHRFGTPQRVSPAGQPASNPALAIARDGSAVVAWRRSQEDSY